MTENLRIDIDNLDDLAGDTAEELYDSLKSPNRSKTWKGSKLRRAKTHSGSPTNKLATNENIQAIANKPIMEQDDKAAPLSPVTTRKGKWNKTNMKRRSTVTGNVQKSYNPGRKNSMVIGNKCISLSTMKVEVRHSSDISNNAVMHRYACPCKQYLDEESGIIYKLQEHLDYDSNIIGDFDNCNKIPKEVHTPLDILNTSIMEEEPQQISTPISFAQNAKVENNVTGQGEFNFDFQNLDDTILELQALQGNLKERNVNEVWADSSNSSCCNQKCVDKRRISAPILQSLSMAETQGDNVVYLLISVFSYLDTGSLLEAGRVCRTWHCAAQHPAVWRNLTVRNKTLTSQALRSLSVSCVSTQQLRITNCTLHEPHSQGTLKELKTFYNAMAGNLKALYLCSNSDDNVLLEEAAVHCTSLAKLHFNGKMLDDHLDAITTNLDRLTCLSISNSKGLNTNQFYESESLKCLTFNASGLRADEIASIIEWFPELTNLHVLCSASLHSAHVKSVFSSSPEKLRNVTFTDCYVTPRAILHILCTQKGLDRLNIVYSHSFADKSGFENSYRTSIQSITNNPLFRAVLRVKFCGPRKPPRSTPFPEGQS